MKHQNVEAFGFIPSKSSSLNFIIITGVWRLKILSFPKFYFFLLESQVYEERKMIFFLLCKLLKVSFTKFVNCSCLKKKEGDV